MRRRGAILGGVALVCAAMVGVFLIISQRQAQCAAIPLIGDELLPNAALAPEPGKALPQGWSAAAAGVELRGPEFSADQSQWGFNLTGRSLQLIGIANEVATPPIPVGAGRRYCFVGRALTDSAKSATRVRAVFDWRDANAQPLVTSASDWQAVPRWTAAQQPDWAYIRAAGTAPAGATTLVVRLQPSSDDRVYLDAMHVRNLWGQGSGVRSQEQQTAASGRPPTPDPRPLLLPWPNGAKAAVAFTFDWETAMGGLIHTRSNRADDPNFDQDWQQRALRMREGVTTTLDLFRPYGIRATYYATGYNFLLGNSQRRQFMGNPTFDWANPADGWPADWSQRPWFSADPFGTVASEPVWYFGDLVPKLQAEQQDIQSHTFAHFAATYVRTRDWQADFTAWRTVASERGVAPARSLAFPWSASNGMSDDEWNTLAANGITSVTRLAWVPSQRKSALFPKDAQGIPIDPRCRPIPGHATILGCPDFYLRDGSDAAATEAIKRAVAAGGMIDLWAHTEEVTDASQRATWSDVIRYAAAERDAGNLWIAPLSEVADWQQALAAVSIQGSGVRGQGSGVEASAANMVAANSPALQRRELQRQIMQFSVFNNGNRDLHGVTLQLPANSARATVDGVMVPIQNAKLSIQNLPAKQTVEVILWPA